MEKPIRKYDIHGGCSTSMLVYRRVFSSGSITCWLGPHFSDEARQQPLCHTNVQQHIILAQGPVVQFPENGQLHHWTHEKKTDWIWIYVCHFWCK